MSREKEIVKIADKIMAFLSENDQMLHELSRSWWYAEKIAEHLVDNGIRSKDGFEVGLIPDTDSVGVRPIDYEEKI